MRKQNGMALWGQASGMTAVLESAGTGQTPCGQRKGHVLLLPGRQAARSHLIRGGLVGSRLDGRAGVYRVEHRPFQEVSLESGMDGMARSGQAQQCGGLSSSRVSQAMVREETGQVAGVQVTTDTSVLS